MKSGIVISTQPTSFSALSYAENLVTGSMELHRAVSNLYQDAHQCLSIACAMRKPA